MAKDKKRCPFSDRICGDWCQLFNNDKCALESIDTWLAAIALKDG